MKLHALLTAFLIPLLSSEIVVISGKTNRSHETPLGLDCRGDEEIYVECPPQDTDMPVYMPHPNDCTKFIECSNGDPYIKCCSLPLLWDQSLLVCNHPGVTTCEISSTIQTTSAPVTTIPTTTAPTTPGEPTSWISSQRITNFGSWGPMASCPRGKFAQGFQLRTETDTGSSEDDTALNSVRLFCGDPSNSSTVSITGKEGFWGDWGEVYTCQKDGVLGYITSFYLRSESDQGPSGDNTAANNFRAICRYSDGSSDEIEGDGLSNGAWYKGYGDCGSNGAICGITTQVLNRQGADMDDSTLNNIDAECCVL